MTARQYIIMLFILLAACKDEGRQDPVIQQTAEKQARLLPDLSDITTPKGHEIKFKTSDKYFYLQWKKGDSLQTLDYSFDLSGADAWFPRLKEENENYLFLRAGCGNPCWIGVFLPLYQTGRPKIINEYLAYDLSKHHVAYINYDTDRLEVLNLKTWETQSFRTDTCAQAFKGYCIDTMFFENNTLCYKWVSKTSVNSDKGTFICEKIKI